MQNSSNAGVVNQEEQGHQSEDYPIFVFRVVVALLCMTAIWIDSPDSLPPMLVIGSEIYLPFNYYGVIGLLVGGWPIFSEARENLRERRMTMELSMSLAIAAGAFSGYFLVWFVIVVFVLIAERIEELTLERGHRAICELLQELSQ